MVVGVGGGRRMSRRGLGACGRRRRQREWRAVRSLHCSLRRPRPLVDTLRAARPLQAHPGAYGERARGFWQLSRMFFFLRTTDTVKTTQIFKKWVNDNFRTVDIF